jgi:hypothetical protein
MTSSNGNYELRTGGRTVDFTNDYIPPLPLTGQTKDKFRVTVYRKTKGSEITGNQLFQYSP